MNRMSIRSAWCAAVAAAGWLAAPANAATAKYVGTGSTDEAQNFRCEAP